MTAVASQHSSLTEPHWQALLEAEFQQPYMQQLRDFLRAEKAQRKVIFPHSQDCFAALNLTPPEQVKVVILGQDPYHGPKACVSRSSRG